MIVVIHKAIGGTVIQVDTMSWEEFERRFTHWEQIVLSNGNEVVKGGRRYVEAASWAIKQGF